MSFKDDVVSWLHEGHDDEAARMLDLCELNFIFVDLLIEVGGGREWEMYDLNIEAPRRVHDAPADVKLRIERAIEEHSQASSMHVRSTAWVPRASPPTSNIDVTDGIAVGAVDLGEVDRIWRKAAGRAKKDPDGAVTAAKALVETVCKHIIDTDGMERPKSHDLPALFSCVLKSLALSPDQQADIQMRRMLGACNVIVSSVGTLRNDLGDAHGKGIGAAAPTIAEAEFAVNAAGGVCRFLLSRWQSARSDTGTAGQDPKRDSSLISPDPPTGS